MSDRIASLFVTCGLTIIVWCGGWMFGMAHAGYLLEVGMEWTLLKMAVLGAVIGIVGLVAQLVNIGAKP